MLQNNVSDAAMWATDHFGYGVNSGGYHQQVRMANRTDYPLSPNPPTVITGFGGIYCDNTVSTGTTKETGFWYTPDNGGGKTPKELYQMTRTITASYPLFAKNINNYNSQGTTFTGGWTFLPGGILYQYGKYTPTDGFNGTQTIPFPVKFNSVPFNIQITLIANSGGTNNSNVVITPKDGTISTTGFKFNATSVPTTAYIAIYWTAIGV
jgi:hypothetical protein